MKNSVGPAPILLSKRVQNVRKRNLHNESIASLNMKGQKFPDCFLGLVFIFLK